MIQHPVVHFEIYAEDPSKLEQFYNALFNWTFEEMAEREYWYVKTTEVDTNGRCTQTGAIDGGMLKRPAGHNVRAWVNYVNVESVDAAVERATALGAKVMKPKSAVPGRGFFAMLIDPEGNPFAVWQANNDAQ